MTYSDALWARIESIYDAILAHPFITGLTDGSLPMASFQYFVVQDAHYLQGYARALAVCAAKAPTETDTRMFAEHASGAIAAERELHAELIDAMGGSLGEAATEPIAPTTLAYTSYLLATTHNGSFAEGLGAVLPCYWIYGTVGEALAARSSPDPLYARWIANYGGPEFQDVVGAVLELTNRVGPSLSEAEHERLAHHFVTTSRYEWMFWDAGYRRERWPL